MNKELQDLIDECTTEINDIEKYITELDPTDKMRRYLTNYALIRAAGITEFVYRSIVVNYFSRLSDSRIDTYLNTTIRQGSMSSKYEKMHELLGKFDDKWRKDFKNAVKLRSDKEKIIDASNSLVNNRHDFAHGRSPTATFFDIKNYYFDVLELIKIFDSVVK